MTTSEGGDMWKNLIIDDRERGIFRVHRDAFIDEAIFAAEKERILDRSWLYVGHKSELDKPGDFVARRVGGRPILFVRGKDGVVRAFLNTCTHRGTVVCRTESGNQSVFQCMYHSWVFSNTGELARVPDDDGYGEGFDPADYALVAPPAFDSYRGFYFLSYWGAVPPLDEYLGATKEYIDLVLDQSAEGMRVIRGSTHYRVRANWKMILENTLDAYHGAYLHSTYMNFLAKLGGGDVNAFQGKTDFAKNTPLGDGHGVVVFPGIFGLPVASWDPSWEQLYGSTAEDDLEAIKQELVARLGQERADLVAASAQNLVVFPTTMFHDGHSILLRVVDPISPGEMEVTYWQFAPREETGDRLQRRLDNLILFLGPSSWATPDDTEAFELCQEAFAAVKEVTWNDVSRGMQREGRVNDENAIREFWRQWYALLSGEPTPVNDAPDAPNRTVMTGE